jgi:hypothetical protein
MSTNTFRTVRKDLTILTSLALLGLVDLSVLTGMGMDDEVEGFLPVDDIHPLIGYTMALFAGLHALLQFGTMRTYVRKRLRDLTGASPRHAAGADRARGDVDCVWRRSLSSRRPIHKRTAR